MDDEDSEGKRRSERERVRQPASDHNNDNKGPVPH